MKNTNNNNQKVLKGQLTIDSILPKEKTVNQITINYIQKQLSIKFKEKLEHQYTDIINNIKITPLNHDRFKYFITAPAEIILNDIDGPLVLKCLYLFDTNSQKWIKLAPYSERVEKFIISQHKPPIDKITINNRSYFITKVTFGNNATPTKIDAQEIFQTLAKKQITDFLNAHKKYYFPRTAKAISKLTESQIAQLKAHNYL